VLDGTVLDCAVVVLVGVVAESDVSDVLVGVVDVSIGVVSVVRVTGGSDVDQPVEVEDSAVVEETGIKSFMSSITRALVAHKLLLFQV